MRAPSTLVRVATRAVVAICGITLLGAAWRQAEVVLMVAGPFAGVVPVVSAGFRGATQTAVVLSASAMGSGATAIPNRLRRGDPADVVIVAEAAYEALVRDSLVVPGSSVRVARSGIGLAVRSGAALPLLRTVADLRDALRRATSIAVSTAASGDYIVKELLPRLGLEAEVAPKIRRVEGEPVGAVVARGEATLGFQQVSELRAIPGIEMVGLLPEEVQRWTVLVGGVIRGALHPAAARAFLDYLTSAVGQAALIQGGLDVRAVP